MTIAKWTLCAAVLLLGVEARAEEKAKAPSAAAEAVAANPPAKDIDDKTTGRKAKLVPFELTEIEEAIVKRTNAERAKFGLVSLEVDRDLMQSARQHAKWMAQNHSMVHTSRPVAENIAMGQPNSSSVLRSWMNSSGHRANILNRSHRKIGVAFFRSANGTPFWCQQFRQ